MVPKRDDQTFAYALVSAVPLQNINATGIAIVYKARDRSTIRTVCQALPDTDPLTAGYEALMRVLEEALHTGVRRIKVYTDLHEIVDQLVRDAEVPRPLLVKHLKTRGMINQLAGVNLVPATSERFSARLIAQSARLPGESPTRRPRPREGNQLTLMPEDTLA